MWWAVCIKEGLMGWVKASSKEEALGIAVRILSIMTEMKIIDAEPQKIDIIASTEFLEPWVGDA